jgi:hypothetical protein
LWKMSPETTISAVFDWMEGCLPRVSKRVSKTARYSSSLERSVSPARIWISDRWKRFVMGIIILWVGYDCNSNLIFGFSQRLNILLFGTNNTNLVFSFS